MKPNEFAQGAERYLSDFISPVGAWENLFYFHTLRRPSYLELYKNADLKPRIGEPVNVVVKLGAFDVVKVYVECDGIVYDCREGYIEMSDACVFAESLISKYSEKIVDQYKAKTIASGTKLFDYVNDDLYIELADENFDIYQVLFTNDDPEANASQWYCAHVCKNEFREWFEKSGFCEEAVRDYNDPRLSDGHGQELLIWGFDEMVRDGLDQSYLTKYLKHAKTL